MLNKDETGSMVFHPALVRAEPGDQIVFKAVAKIHMVKSINTMAPDGVKPVVGAMGADTTVTLTKEGVYGLECLPHYGMGMVALVVVGKPDAEKKIWIIARQHPGESMAEWFVEGFLDRLLDRQEEGGGTRLTQTCPLSGPIANLVGWTSLTVPGAPGLGPMRQGMALLLALTLTLSGSLAWLARSWSRRIGRLTAEIAAHDGASLPRVSPTGASDVDQVVAALNQASARLEAALEEARTQSARAAAAERLAALGRVAAGVAHEIRNPIAAMRLRAESGLAGDDTRRRGALGAILGQIDRLDRLSAELLAVTQRRAPELQDVDLAAFLAAIIRDHAAPHLNFNIAAAGTARCDPAMIRRALDNLVLNASRYLAQGGTISLSASRITGRLLMTVADTGPGVDPALRDRLFEPFVTSRPDGTGLGLAIAREMVQAHGGTITLAPGSGGAVFTIEIPQP